uniref:Reverse transcriptase domain-containing protein n=1 Tax=Trichuris muris TaxID=70415 RepID=A0A5S6QF95_TRIMR
MKEVLCSVLGQDPAVREGTSAYIDDILVNEDVVMARRVEQLLARFGLACKPHIRVADERRRRWQRIGPVETRRSVFSYCGKLIGHFPVCGWLRVAEAFIKRKVNDVTASWDQVIKDAELEGLINEVANRVKTDDPVRRKWNVSGNKANVWIDASSMAHGVVVEVGDCIVEDAAWLLPDDACHIKHGRTECRHQRIEARNLLGMRNIELMTDSSTIHLWISDGPSGKARLKMKAASEMLIRRRVDTVLSLVKEYNLEFFRTLVNSASNKEDVLTRVPQRWLHPTAAIPSLLVQWLSSQTLASWLRRSITKWVTPV